MSARRWLGVLAFLTGCGGPQWVPVDTAACVRTIAAANAGMAVGRVLAICDATKEKL